MKAKSVKVFAPATISNLGSGFDVLGIAIHLPGDIVVASRTQRVELDFRIKHNKLAPQLRSTMNVAEHVAQLMIQELKPGFGLQLTLDKRMPIGSGLGSSAASSVASVVAVNALLAKPLQRRDLLRFAVEGERLATGSAHADNAAPCLFGGAQLIRSYEPLDVIALPVRNVIHWIVVHPHLVVKTKDARNVLPQEIPLRSAVRQWGNVGGMVAGLVQGNAALVGTCTEDVVAEPLRAALVNGFHDVQRAALEAGAYGCTLSGSGPSMFAVASSAESARRIAAAMRRTFLHRANVKSDVFISKINMQGAKVLAKTNDRKA